MAEWHCGFAHCSRCGRRCARIRSPISTRASTSFIIRSGVGGSYDSSSRLLGRHIGKHIPGNPSVVPVNMPGGGGIRSANYVGKIAPQDGTILTIVSQGLVVDQALGLNPTFQADLRDFNWVGNQLRRPGGVACTRRR